MTTWNQWELDELRVLGRLPSTLPSANAFQRAAFEGLVERLIGLLRPNFRFTVQLGRGASTFERMLESFCNKWESHNEEGTGVPWDASLAVAAQNIKTCELRLPAEAGHLDTAALLSGDEAAIFSSSAARVVELPCGSEEPRPCFMISEAEELVFRERLLSTGMAVPIAEAAIARRSDGRPLLNGAFAVAHKKGQRAIFDCRPANASERRLTWGSLPAGPMFCGLRIPRALGLRGSGDDLENWFYQLQEAGEMIPRRAFGRRISGKAAAQLGLDPNGRFRLALRVLGMGTANAPDVAQCVHERLLLQHGCLAEGTVLRYRQPLPTGPLLEGVYLDDHLVVGVVPRNQLRSSDGPDLEIIRRSHAAYREANVRRSTDKAFGFSLSREPAAADVCFLAWGTEVNGDLGTVGAPVRKRLELLALVLVAVGQPVVSKVLVSRLLGLLVHPLIHNRPLMSALQTVYTWHAELDEKALVRWPPHIREEFLVAGCHLLVAEVNVHDPVSCIAGCTDATPQQGGAVRAVLHPELTGFLYDHGEHRGEHTRLDWVGDRYDCLFPTSMTGPTEFTREVIRGVAWSVSRSCGFGQSAHINIQELREVVRELKARASMHLSPERSANFIDSRVVLGCYAKGRSSSRMLNRTLRTSVGPSILSSKRQVNTWAASEDNPADAPSRNRQPDPPSPRSCLEPALGRPQLPTPRAFLECSRFRAGCRPTSSELQAVQAAHPVMWHLWSETRRERESFWCREVGPGAGPLALALANLGLAVRPGLDPYPRPRVYVRDHDMTEPDVYISLLTEAVGGWYRSLHFKLPFYSTPGGAEVGESTCGRRRPRVHRLCFPDEPAGVEQVSRVVTVCLALARRGGLFTIEVPAGSALLGSDPLQVLCQHVPVWYARVDQCAYGLCPPSPASGEHVLRRTVFLANFVEIQDVVCLCPGLSSNHFHVPAVGRRRLQVSGRVGSVSVATAVRRHPFSLAVALARLVEASLASRSLVAGVTAAAVRIPLRRGSADKLAAAPEGTPRVAELRSTRRGLAGKY